MKILVVNCGSSSIKYQLFDMKGKRVLAKGLLEKIGEGDSLLTHTVNGDAVRIAKAVQDHQTGLQLVIEALLSKEHGAIERLSEICAVGHRVVHGGEQFSASSLITDEVVEGIREYCHLAPLHNPPNLLGIEAAQSALPDVPHVAVFDTAFHETIPPHAYMYALPYRFYEQHRLRRYGFHGTSHRYVSQRAAEFLGKPLEEFNAITCHLGNGCSITAVRKGKSVDTSMGFTPLEGVVMGTRSGDIDPAIIPFLVQQEHLGMDEIDTILNKKSGLLGLSGVSNDIREVHAAAQEGNERAKLALQVFAYRIKKYIGAYSAVLGSVDAVVFTGGIGENDAEIRAAVCGDLRNIGIHLDESKNASCRACEADISTKDSPVRVLIIPTNEELLIAQDTMAIALVDRGA
jgi:acetate kinase